MVNNQQVKRPFLHANRVIVGALVVAAYLAGAWTLEVGQVTGTAAPWWPAAGIGVVAVLRTPRRHWPTVLGLLLFAFALANLTAGRSVLVSSLLGVADVTETIIVATLIRKYVGRYIEDIADVWRLFAIATAGALVAATGIALVFEQLLSSPLWPTLGPTMAAHAASVVLLAPVALLRREKLGGAPRKAELAVQVCLLLAATLVTFGSAQVTLGFAPLPIIVWAAVRFGTWVVVLEQILYATAVTVLTLLGWGTFAPLAEADPGHHTQHAQLFLLCLVIICLPLATLIAQRDRALLRLSASERVFRRTFTESRVPVALVMLEDGQVTFSDCNEATAGVLGRTTSDLVGQRLDEHLAAPGLMAACHDIIDHDATGWSGQIAVHADPRVRLDGVLSLLEPGEDRAFFSLFMADVTEPVELQERLQAERDYTRAVVDTASSMIVLTRPDGTVIAANPATTMLTGFSEEELVGRPVWQLLIATDQQADVEALFAGKGLPRNGEAQLQTKDGHQKAVTFSTDVHRASADAPVTVVISAIDVTDARQNAGMVNNLLRSARTIAFVGTDLTGRITLFNTGAERMLGIDAAGATGRDLVEFIAPEDLARNATRAPGQSVFEALVDHAAGDLAPETRDWTWLPEGRAPLKVSMTTNPVIDTFGDLFGYLFVASDITDTRRSQEILVKALQRERQVVARLKDIDQVKDDFITTVSHELRTPMSSIIGSAEMLADGMMGELEPEQQRVVDVITRNGDRLLALADDLLLLAAYDQNSVQEQTIPVDLRAVVEESAGAVAGMLAHRDLDVGYSLGDEPVFVSGDPSHLERAVTNLLSNSVKFTPDGGHVHVAVGCEAPAGSAMVSVTDTGFGIAEADMSKLFDRFWRSVIVQERAIQGSGLGLPIVKTIVESHEGQIEVRSEEGIGTTFTIILPRVGRVGRH